jgi:hypothetical protein
LNNLIRPHNQAAAANRQVRSQAFSLQRLELYQASRRTNKTSRPGASVRRWRLMKRESFRAVRIAVKQNKSRG